MFSVFIWLSHNYTLLGTNISHQKVTLKVIFLFQWWEMYPFPGGYALFAGIVEGGYAPKPLFL